jgi:hypothetical protein
MFSFWALYTRCLSWLCSRIALFNRCLFCYSFTWKYFISLPALPVLPVLLWLTQDTRVRLLQIQYLVSHFTFDFLYRFSYPSRRDVDVLKGISLIVSPGKKLALVNFSPSLLLTVPALFSGYHPTTRCAVFVFMSATHCLKHFNNQCSCPNINSLAIEPQRDASVIFLPLDYLP